jgi:hypothetical protein
MQDTISNKAMLTIMQLLYQRAAVKGGWQDAAHLRTSTNYFGHFSWTYSNLCKAGQAYHLISLC